MKAAFDYRLKRLYFTTSYTKADKDYPPHHNLFFYML